MPRTLWPEDTLVYLGGERMDRLDADAVKRVLGPEPPASCVTTVDPDVARAWLRSSPRASLRPVVVLDARGIVAGAQAARFMLMTDTVANGVLRRVDSTEGWAVTVAEAKATFRRGGDPLGPDMPAIVMSGDGRVRHGADVLGELVVPTTVLVVIE
jgi:hypothetical protein